MEKVADATYTNKKSNRKLQVRGGSNGMKEKRQYRDDTYIRYSQYENMWIALTPDESELLASSANLQEVAKVAQKKGCAHPRYIHIPPADLNFAF